MSEIGSRGDEQLRGQLEPWNVISVVDGRRGVTEEDAARLGLLIIKRANASKMQRTATTNELIRMGNVAHRSLNALAWSLGASSSSPDSKEYKSHMSGLHGSLAGFGEIVRAYAPGVPELTDYSSKLLPPRPAFVESPTEVLDRFSEKGLLVDAFPEPKLLHGHVEAIAAYAVNALTDVVWENDSFIPLDTEGEQRFQLLTDSYLQLEPALGE